MFLLYIHYPSILVGIANGNKRCHLDISEFQPGSFISSASLKSLAKLFNFSACLKFLSSDDCDV